ncbi:hypothetical protein [Lacticaseibacillus hulanensis]|uniref:hypothetical protein n=1 Tax=Lacticaseibacillus hulanensis TaxID=2493111 RepID=UPI000FD84CEE|nr:hypothetical protein [Lacticaseibacillus hulanensis]
MSAGVTFLGMGPGDWVAVFTLISLGGGALYQMFKFVNEMHEMVEEFKQIRKQTQHTTSVVNNNAEVLTKHDGEIQSVFNSMGLKRIPSRITHIKED